MSRTRVAALITAVGVLTVVAPSVVTGTVGLLPGVDVTAGSLPLRIVGVVYLVGGALVAWNVRTDRSNRSSRVAGVLLACALGLAVVVRLSDIAFGPEVFLPAFCVLFPLAVGSTDSVEALALSIVAVVGLMLGGIVLYEPSVANAMGDLTVVFAVVFWIAFGVPLYAVGREWRAAVPKRT